MFQVLLEQNFSDLKSACVAAKKNAYSIHSNFRVGSAVLSFNGNIYSGSSVDCSIYGLSICAERSALLKVLVLIPHPSDFIINVYSMCATKL